MELGRVAPPPRATRTPAVEERPRHSSHEAPDLTPGLRLSGIRESTNQGDCFRNVPLACVLKYWPDGKALPKRLDRFSMPFFKPPANTLDPYQLELCADAFRQTWIEIAGLSPPSLPRGASANRSEREVMLFRRQRGDGLRGASRPNRSHC